MLVTEIVMSCCGSEHQTHNSYELPAEKSDHKQNFLAQTKIMDNKSSNGFEDDDIITSDTTSESVQFALSKSFTTNHIQKKISHYWPFFHSYPKVIQVPN